MPEPTPDAWAQIRHDYEHTERPLAHICAEHGITVPMLRYRLKRWEWHRRKPLIPREGPPAVEIDPPVIPERGPETRSGASSDALWAANPESITPAAAYGFRARAFGASRNDGEVHPTPPAFAHAAASDPPPPGERKEVQAGRGDEGEPAPIVPRLQGATARVLTAIESIIARLAAGPCHPREMEQAGRALSSLTRTLRELNALLSQHKADDDAPAAVDMDEFRHELSRRLKGIIAARKQSVDEAKHEET